MRFAAELAKQIGDVAERGIGGDAAESVGAAALQSDGERGERSGCAGDAIGFNKARKCLLERAGHENGFAAGTLLIEEEDRLGQSADRAREARPSACWTAHSGSRG